MYVARVLYPVEVLGPGKRIGIWFCGCPRRCNGCSNPELWEFRDKYITSPKLVYEFVLKIAENYVIDGFTLTGGEPLYQAEELRLLIALLKNISDDILVYTGYSIEEIDSKRLDGISVLIDGEYIEERNNDCVLRGSDNQKIHILDSKYEKKYGDYLSKTKNRIQNFMTSDGVVSVGIHKPNFINKLNDTVSKKGLI